MINTEYIGYVDPGEYLASAAIREVKEETGVETEFQSIIAFRYFIFISFDFRSLNHLLSLNENSFTHNYTLFQSITSNELRVFRFIFYCLFKTNVFRDQDVYT